MAGIYGLYLLPLIGYILLLLGCSKIIKFINKSYNIIIINILLTGLCTPLLFYSMTFWEHLPAAALCIWAVYFSLKSLNKKKSEKMKLLAKGAILTGLSVYFRDSLYVFSAILFLMLLFFIKKEKIKSLIITGSVFSITLIPLYLLQWKLSGQPFGFHLSSHITPAQGILDIIKNKPAVVYNLLIAIHPNKIISLIFVIPFLISFLLNPKFPKKYINLISCIYIISGTAMGIISLSGYFFNKPALYMLQSSNSFLSVSPVLILSFFTFKNSKNEQPEKEEPEKILKFIYSLALVFTIFYVIAAPEEGSKGIHWGNRFMLILYPMLMLPATFNIIKIIKEAKVRILIPLLTIIILISFSAQIYSLNFLHRKKSYSYNINRVIAGMKEEIVISDIWWSLQELHSQFYEKKLFYLKDKADFNILIDNLKGAGHSEVLILTALNENENNTRNIIIRDNKLGMFNLQLFKLKI